MPLLELADVKKSFRSPDGETQLILDVPTLALEAREHVALVGSSGSGKTTLLNVIAGILRADSGAVRLAGIDLARASESARDALRAQNIGYVFQSFNLLQGFSALENVLLGMTFGPGADREFARALPGRPGLGHRLHHRPAQLSIGQQQRVAHARALANRPRLVLADEPTGSLDAVHAREAIDLLRGLCEEHEAALLVVSHDPALIDSFDRVLRLEALNRAAAGAGTGVDRASAKVGREA